GARRGRFRIADQLQHVVRFEREVRAEGGLEGGEELALFPCLAHGQGARQPEVRDGGAVLPRWVIAVLREEPNPSRLARVLTRPWHVRHLPKALGDQWP